MFCLIFHVLLVADTPQNRAALKCELLADVCHESVSKPGLELELDIEGFDAALELPEAHEKLVQGTCH
jgi:hypothetical protein